MILEAGGKTVTQPADVSAVINEAKKDGRKAVLLRVKNGDDMHFVALAVNPRLTLTHGKTHDPERRRLFGRSARNRLFRSCSGRALGGVVVLSRWPASFLPPSRRRRQGGGRPGAISGLPFFHGIAYMSSMRILIIEDDSEAALYLVKAFREAGHVADHAPDGVEGYDKARDEGL